MRRMTRKEAAEYLGVTISTISNYMAEGLLGGFKDHKNLIYVNAEDVEKYAKQYRMIPASEKMLQAKIEELERLRNEVKEEIAELRKGFLGPTLSYFSHPVIGNAMSSLIRIVGDVHIPRREEWVLHRVLSGDNLSDIAEAKGVTIERIRQITVNACRHLCDKEEELRKDYKSNAKLLQENEALCHDILVLQEFIKNIPGVKFERELLTPPALFYKKIPNCGFSVRVTNSLTLGGIETVGDMITKFNSIQHMLAISGLGRVSLREIEEFMEENHLTFRRKNEGYKEYFARLTKYGKYKKC